MALNIEQHVEVVVNDHLLARLSCGNGSEENDGEKAELKAEVTSRSDNPQQLVVRLKGQLVELMGNRALSQRDISVNKNGFGVQRLGEDLLEIQVCPPVMFVSRTDNQNRLNGDYQGTKCY